VRTSYALQSDYERLLRIVGRVTAREIERMADRFTLASDARDETLTTDWRLQAVSGRLPSR
jgi:hypothetical protein